MTGATGAGTSLSKTSHFTWRDNNYSYYKPFEHQHLKEVYQSIKQYQEEFSHDINFIPTRGNFSRGIFATIYIQFFGSLEDVISIYNEFYKDAALTFVTHQELHLKQVVNTNKAMIQIEKTGSKLVVHSITDNLLKGAASQAVQCANISLGLPSEYSLLSQNISGNSE